LSQAIEQKYNQVRHLITLGKERGYLLLDEVNDILPTEIDSFEEINDLLSTFEGYGINVYKDVSEAKAAASTSEAGEQTETEAKEEDAPSHEVELDLTPGLLDKTNDPVRIYLREMGLVPLLTREGEVALAKRIERGRLLVLKTITRSPIVIKELFGIAKDLREGTRSIKEIVPFDDGS
jgi:RNA polymerase primary sigma factor